MGVFVTLYALMLGRRYGARVGWAVAVGWVVPGAGHWLLGRRRKAAALAAILAGLYAVGLVLSAGHTVAWEDSPFFYLARYGSGVTWLLGEVLDTPRAHIPGGLPASWLDAGLLYVAAPGLLNLAIVINLPLAVRRDGEAAA